METDPNYKEKKLRSDVIKLIKHKLQPLNMKYFRFKYENSQNFDRSSLDTSFQSNKSHNKQMSKFKKLKKRRALVKLPSKYSANQYYDIQKKVELHLQMKKINIMKANYSQAQEKGIRKQFDKTQQSSPLKKYLDLFKSVQLPSQKLKYVQQETITEMIRKIEQAKSQKQIKLVEDNTRNLWNGTKRHKNNNKENNIYELPAKISKNDQKKLNVQIRKQMQKQYRNENSSKIRINMNHKKMINMK